MAKEPGVGGWSTICGLTGRLPLSHPGPLTMADRNGPGLMGRLSFSMVRLEAACRWAEGVAAAEARPVPTLGDAGGCVATVSPATVTMDK